MVELAVPLLALGGMYVISQDKKNKEGYTNMTQRQNSLPGINPPTPTTNFPLTEPVTSKNNINAYLNPNQYSDKYYNPKNYASNEKTQPSN